MASQANSSKQTQNAPRQPKRVPLPARSSPRAQAVEALQLQRAMAQPGAASPRALLALQRTGGNRAVQRLLASRAVQAKLSVGPAGDKYEQEADRVAGEVMHMPAPSAPVERPRQKPALTSPVGPSISPTQRQSPPPEEELQGKPADSSAGFEAGPGFEDRLRASAGGSPLPPATRAFMEPRFGADFAGVRVHTDSQSAQLSREIGAQAFTHGPDIYMPAGKYDPASSAGRQLLAHELTHTIQQGAVQLKGPADQPAATPGEAIARKPEAGLIQRAVGFEFEVGGYEVEQLNNNMTAPQKAATTPIQPADLGDGTLRKGKALAANPGFEMQIDEGARDFHLEFVTTGTGFPETDAGRTSLKTAMEGMQNLGREVTTKTGSPGPQKAGVGRLVESGEVTGGMGTLPETVIHGVGPMAAEPQTTTGVRLDQLPALMENMASPVGEAPKERQKRSGQRATLAGKSNANDTLVMKEAAPAARTAIANFKNQMALAHAALPANFGSDSLVGFMALIYTYLKKASLTKINDYPKSIFPLLGISNFASMFATLPADDRTPFTANPQQFVDINLDAMGLPGTGAAKFFTKGFGAQLTNMTTVESAHTAAVLGVISRRDWLHGIPQNDDVLTKAYTATAGAEVAALESMGKLTHGEQVGQTHTFRSDTQTQGVILELRRFAGNVGINNWKDLALDVFDFMVKLNDLKTGEFTKRRYDMTKPK